MNQYANHYGYSDVNPYEVVRVVSDKTLEVRAMNAELDTSWKPDFVPGGFSAYCTNQCEQRWVITSDKNAKTIRIRLGKQGWKSADGRKFKLSDKPKHFYDYNF